MWIVHHSTVWTITSVQIVHCIYTHLPLLERMRLKYEVFSTEVEHTFRLGVLGRVTVKSVSQWNRFPYRRCLFTVNVEKLSTSRRHHFASSTPVVGSCTLYARATHSYCRRNRGTSRYIFAKLSCWSVIFFFFFYHLTAAKTAQPPLSSCDKFGHHKATQKLPEH